MPADPLLRSWLVEALSILGPSAVDPGGSSALDVAKVVWTRHEHDLRSSGDLLFTWQLGLVAAADSLLSEGLVLVDESGRMSLAERADVPAPVRRGWSPEEIAVAVEGYVALLTAEHGGEPINRRAVLADISARTGRGGDQLEAMLCNISAVVQEHGLAPLSSHRPRSNVPAGVRPAVAAALSSDGATTR